MPDTREPDTLVQPLLSHFVKGQMGTITGFAVALSAEQEALRRRLIELGFAPGEHIRVVAESFPGRDPMAVRVDNTLFALRRCEAALIHVLPEH